MDTSSHTFATALAFLIASTTISNGVTKALAFLCHNSRIKDAGDALTPIGAGGLALIAYHIAITQGEEPLAHPDQSFLVGLGYFACIVGGSLIAAYVLPEPEVKAKRPMEGPPPTLDGKPVKRTRGRNLLAVFTLGALKALIANVIRRGFIRHHR